MNHQKTKFTVAVALVALLLVSCVPAATPQAGEGVTPEEVTIEVWMMPLTDDYAATLAPYVEDFEEKNPGIRVKLTVIPWSGSLQKQITAFKGGAAPDVIYTSPNRIIPLEAAGAIAPLEGYADDAYQVKLQPGLLDAGYWKGHLYGVPFTSYGRALYYNVDIFEEAGISEPPTNWEEFREVAEKVTGGDVYAFSLSGTDSWLGDYRGWLYQAGGKWLSEDNKNCVVNSPESVEAMQFLVDLALDNLMYPGSGAAEVDNFGLFAAGTTAMIIQSNYVAKLQETSEVNFATALIPQYGKGNPAIGLAESEWLSVTSSSQHKDEAWKFLEYFSTDPDLQLNHNIDITFFPTIADIDFPMVDPRIEAHLADTALPFAPVIMHPKAPELTDLIRNELNRAFLGEISVQEALDTACANVDAVLAEEQ